MEMLERRVKSATAFFDFVLAVFSGERSQSPFFLTRLSILRISFYEIATISAYWYFVQAYFFFKNRIPLSKLITKFFNIYFFFLFIKRNSRSSFIVRFVSFKIEK